MASIDYSIKDVENVVKFEGEVKNVEVSRLTSPGENYRSLVLRVDFKVENKGNSKTISTVAKRLPLNNKKGRMDFNAITMKNEIKWYSEILPLIKDFAKENDIKMDIYPENYGGRYSLDPSKEEADSDSVLLLENLIPQGYQNDDRYIGCDLDTSKASLKSLALFHALPIAIKVKRPDLFQVIKDYLEKSSPKPDKDKEYKKPLSGAQKPEEVLLEQLVNIAGLTPYMPKIKPFLGKPFYPELLRKIAKEPWNTISHNDFWLNNVMVNRRNGNGPTVKIVDFQMYSYESFAKDLVFFLLTSLRNDVTKKSMDDLLKFYYDEFTSVLRKVNVDLELSYEDYLEEVRATASEAEFFHAVYFSTIVFGEKGTGVDIFVDDFKPEEHFTGMMKKMSQLQKDKLVLIATESAKRNWI